MKFFAILLLAFSFLFASIDINSASAKELTTLKGIGIKKAEAIVAYRKAHCFTKIDELMQVKGIGKKIVEKNRANLQVGSCKKSSAH